MSAVKSPLTHGPAQLIMKLDKNELVSRYKSEYDMDVARFFTALSEICLYECNESGYRFFYPLNFAGDGPFYEELEVYPWYYAKNKWDYENALKYINSQKEILDIGCGEGNFLKMLREKGIEAQGLELNEQAIKNGTASGLKISQEFIEDHGAKNKNKYDLVCFFQVLEHIADVKSFLSAAVESTKVGGEIIIAVPNNYPYFLKTDKYHTLNWPPHHMGWWNESSLSNLTKIFPLKVKSIDKAPLQHFKTYTNNILAETSLPKGIQKLISPLVKVYFYLKRNTIPGASIMVVYEKTGEQKE